MSVLPDEQRAPHQDLLGPAAADPFTGKSMEEVIAFCRASGIRKLRYRGVEIEFAENPGGSRPLEPEALQKFAQDLAGGVPDDLDMLGWSAGGDFRKDMEHIMKLLNPEPAAGE